METAVLIFRVRVLCVLVLLAASVAFPSVEDGNRLAAGAALLGMMIYSIGMWRMVQRTRRVPAIFPLIDVIGGVANMYFFPDLWVPSMLVMCANLVIASVLLGARVVTASATIAVVSAGAIGVREFGIESMIAPWLAFTAAVALSTIPVYASTRRGHQAEGAHQTLLDTVHAVAWECSPDESSYTYLSNGVQRILGHDPRDLISVDFWMSIVHPEDRADLRTARHAVDRFGHGTDINYRIRRKDGQWIWLHEVITVSRRHDHHQIRGVAIDVTAQRTAEQGQRLYTELVEHISTALIIAKDTVERGLVTIAANPAAAKMLGTSTDRLVDQVLSDRLSSLDPSVTQRLRSICQGGDSFSVDRIEGIGIDRQKIFSLQAFGLPDGAVGLSLEDVTGSAMVAAALRRQALHDGLTGLPNRTLLRDRLQFALSDAERRNERVALILMDLDHFKEVNDALGHQYGDRLLTAFAHRLQHLVRECDTIARLGGDEFALLLTNATNEGASRVVTKVTEAMQEPFEIDGVTLQTTASLGVALYPDHADDADLLTQRADVAMYTAKRGGGGWSVYSPAHDQSSIERLTLLTDLHRELDHLAPSELTLYYQPILDLKTDRITGAEALLRWPHPEHGFLNPELVVELAELSGLIQNLARFVASDALQACASWRLGGHDLRVAINLSARNLYDRQLLTWLQDLLRETHVPPNMLKCELTESEVMDDPVLAMDVLSQLREIGVHTAVDDFGTGYSSLSYLRKLPVDEIKIDKSFVMTMMQDRNDMTIVKTVIDLAHNLGKDVLAEGVEDAETLEQLREFGCDRIQGYLIGRPMPNHEFLQVVTSINTPPQTGPKPADSTTRGY